MIPNLVFGYESPYNNDSVKSGKKLPYSKKLTYNDVNTKVVNMEEINQVEEILRYFFNECSFGKCISTYMNSVQI